MIETKGLWNRVIRGELAAFEEVVRQYQNAVASVAYSIVGDFATSQDVAQETFWIAWRARSDLREPSKLAAWLCGIARNQARQWQRRESRQPAPHDHATAPVLEPSESPAEVAVSAEERALVWQALQDLPDNYREVFVLFYREGQSLSEVAAALDLSADAVKQRLYRGRQMMRAQLADIVEGVLTQTRPGRRFTSRVMAGLAGAAALVPGTSSAATQAVATGATAAAKVAMATGGIGAAGGVLGALGGIGGAWLGTWLPAQLAPTESERRLLQRHGGRMMLVSILFAILILALCAFPLVLPGRWVLFFVCLLTASLAYSAYIVSMAVFVQRETAAIRRAMSSADDPNESPWKESLQRVALFNQQVLCVSYRSRWSLAGWPLLAVQFAGPQDSPREPLRGWIAIGDRPVALLIAIGGIARGLIAIGGVAIGGIALGGAAVGGLAIGGGVLGVIALGGIAAGWDAAGGGAIGWHSATGGGAIAHHVAFGGLAVARDFAAGGEAYAEQANTPLAREVAQRESLKWMMDWYIAHRTLALVITLVVAVAPTVILALFAQWRQRAMHNRATSPP